MAYVPYEGYKSAGETVSDSLEKILTERAATKRQAIMDDIHRQNIQSQIRDRDATAAYRTQLAQERAQALQDKANQARLTHYTPGQTADEWLQKTYPETVKTSGGEDYQPEGPTQEGGLLPMGQMPVKKTFGGTPAYQAQQQKIQQLKDLQDENTGGWMEPSDLLLRMMQIDPEKTDSKTMEALVAAQSRKKESEQSPMIGFDENTGKSFKIDDPYNAGKPAMGKPGEVVKRTRPPVAASNPFMGAPFMGTDPADGQQKLMELGKDGRAHPITVAPQPPPKPSTPGTTGASSTSPAAPIASAQRLGGPGTNKPGAITPDMRKTLTNSMLNIRSRPKDEAALAAHDALVNQAVGGSTYADPVKTTVSSIWNSPGRKTHSMTSEQVLSLMDGGTDAERAEVASLWKQISGQP